LPLQILRRVSSYPPFVQGGPEPFRAFRPRTPSSAQKGSDGSGVSRTNGKDARETLPRLEAASRKQQQRNCGLIGKEGGRHIFSHSA